jgi:hypothetical protein
MNVGGDGTSTILSSNSTYTCTMNNVIINVTAKAEDQIDGKHYRILGSINTDKVTEAQTGVWTNVYTIADLAIATRDLEESLSVSKVDDIIGHTTKYKKTYGGVEYPAGTLITEEIAQAIIADGINSVIVKNDVVVTASNVSAEIAETYKMYGYKYWSQRKLATDIKSYVDAKTMAGLYTTEDIAKTAYKALTDTKLWEVQAYMDGETVVGYIPVWVGAQA